MGITAGILRRALDVTEKSEYYPYKVGAVVFKGSRILSEGTNAIRGCTRVPSEYKKFCHTLHAEQDALSKLLNNPDVIKGASILVIRINNNAAGKISMAKPCEFCQKMIEDYGIRNVYYSDYNGEIKKMRIKR